MATKKELEEEMIAMREALAQALDDASVEPRIVAMIGLERWNEAARQAALEADNPDVELVVDAYAVEGSDTVLTIEVLGGLTKAESLDAVLHVLLRPATTQVPEGVDLPTPTGHDDSTFGRIDKLQPVP